MDYKKYLDKQLINQVKEQIEDNDENTFALVLINEQHSDYESVFDDLEMNHNFSPFLGVRKANIRLDFYPVTI